VITRANAIVKPPVVKAPSVTPATSTVTVKAGDTLGEIAVAHKLTLKALLAFTQNAKYRANPGLIHAGDIVRVK
jgi:LysM repeat protein